TKCSEALGECQRLDIPKYRFRAVAVLQVVVRNPRFQMMDVMKADVPGEPLQDLGQLEVAAALEGYKPVVPFLATLPVRLVELVLNVKQPHTGAASHRQNGELEQQVRTQADRQRQGRPYEQDGQICPPHRMAPAYASLRTREPLQDQEQHQRTHHEEHEGVSCQTIS